MPKSSQKTTKQNHLTAPAIAVSGISVRFGAQYALENVSLKIPSGSFSAIIGPNGSGKSTLIKVITGLMKPHAGQVRILGRHLHDVRHAIGYVPQKFDFDRNFPITVKEFLNLAAHKHLLKGQIENNIEDVGLSDQILDQALGTLSGGQLQRVLIAQALLKQPSILILDEPASGIDITGEEQLMSLFGRLVDEHGTTIVLVSHDISSVAKNVDQVICLNKKLICAGSPSKTLSKKQLKQLFGEHKELYHHHH